VGHEIVYCAGCQTQLRSIEFEKGKAFRIESRFFCFACVSKDPNLLPSELLLPEAAPTPPGTGSGPRITPAAPPRRGPNAEHPTGLLWIGLCGAAGVIGLVVIVALAAGRPSPPPSARAAPEVAEPAPPDPLPETLPPVREERPEPRVRETPRNVDPETAQKKEREARETELASLDQEVRAACAKEEFHHAIGLLEKAGARHPGGEWTMWIEKRTADLHKQADALYAPLREKALSARRRGAASEARAVAEQVARWGLPRLRDDLERALAAPLAERTPTPAAPPPPPPVPAETKTLKAHWEAAAALASWRDYAGAVAEMERAAASIRDAGVRAEATADLEAFRQASALLGDALQALSKSAKGQKIALATWDDVGDPRRVEGVVSKVEAHRIEVRSDAETIMVEFGEVVPGSLGEKAPKKDARAAVLLCLLEGDLEGARRHPRVEVPEKYWAHARRTAEGRAKPAPRERQAKEILVSADREAGDSRSAAGAIQKFEMLVKDFGDTAFVRRNRPSIASRADSASDFLFFAADITAAGGFRLARNAKGESSWTTELDPDGARGMETSLSDLTWTSATNGWGPVEIDKSNGEKALGDGRTIKLNGVEYPKGLGTHAPAELKYALGGKYTAFAADVGVDDFSGNGSVVFQVWADGTMLFESGLMRQDTATKAVNVSLAGKQELRLAVTDGGDGITNDVASWAGARLVGGGGIASFKGAHLDLEFSAAADREYRCWLYVGGCCAEGLAFHVQGTDLVAPHPKTKEPAAAEPGGEASAPVKHGLSLATRTHAGHGPRKEPARWGWVQVPLPKYAASGLKKLRVLADQRGLWVAFACVSAVKTAPPRESEVKEIEKAKPEVTARLPGEKGPAVVITNTSPKGYVWEVADLGKAQYVDRDFKLMSGPPSFVGQRFLRTANEDKSSKGSALIAFEVNQPVTVYVAHDERVATKPAWLASFSATGEKVMSGAGSFKVYAKDFPAGRVTLGGNTADGQSSGLSMYTVALRPRGR